jgi:hypothetical protein
MRRVESQNRLVIKCVFKFGWFSNECFKKYIHKGYIAVMNQSARFLLFLCMDLFWREVLQESSGMMVTPTLEHWHCWILSLDYSTSTCNKVYDSFHSLVSFAQNLS